MIEILFQLLFGYDGFIQEKQLFKLLVAHTPIDMDSLRKELQQDQRFISDKNNSWSIAPLEQFVKDQALEDVNFIITDIETTGSIQGKDRIIDLAAQKIRAGEIVDSFEQLINPEQKISYTISRITGISNETVQNAPTIEEILQKYTQFFDNGIFVAHNSDFDYRFIRAEQDRLNIQPFKTPIDICTYRIAKKLLPNLKTCGISGLAKHFGYEMNGRHRALPDVEATSFFFKHFTTQLEKLNISTLHHLINFQKKLYSRKELQKKLKNAQKKRTNQKRLQ